MRVSFISILLSIILSSCYSYRIFPKEYRTFTYAGQKKKAFILDPELARENEIIKMSGIFDFTNDSTGNSVLKIKLYPLKRDFKDAPGAFVWLFTIGQLPMLVRDRYKFEFAEIQNADTVQRKFEMNITMRYWFWDMFIFNKKFNQKAAQTLLANYYHD